MEEARDGELQDMKHYTGITKQRNGKYRSRYSSTDLGQYDSVLEAVMARDREMIRRQKVPRKERQSIRIEGFAERLNEAIWASDMDISEICRQSGISRSCMWSYRYTATMPPSGILARIAITLNVSADYLLGIERRKEA